MNDYIKQLEDRNEELQERLVTAEHLVHTLASYNKKISFFVYTMEVRQSGCEWEIWSVQFERKPMFSQFEQFKTTLKKYDEIVFTSSRRFKVEPFNGSAWALQWDKERCWKISVTKKKDKWLISHFETYQIGDAAYHDDGPEKIIDKPFSKHLKRWLK